MPDTIFTLNFQDQPFGTTWGYSRAANPVHRGQGPDDRNFLMPHFSFWAWKLPFIGSLGRAAAAIDRIEEAHPTLASKIPKAVWRGTSWYNSVHNPRLRQSLLTATKGKPWADVEALTWVGDNATNAIPVEDFCRYRYVLHTEGVAYSGRFQFLQLCGSVVLTPPIQWMQHTTHLARPVFAADIPALQKAGSKESHASRERARKAWPRPYTPGEANIVFVAPDWSNLEETIAWLEAHPDIAQGIARRQRDVYAGGGYFSPAAEACYWRALVRGWSKVARIDETEWSGKEGVTFEAFALSNE